MIFKLWNSTKLSHIHFCNTQNVFHFTLLYEVVVKDLERWQNSSSETSGGLTLSDLTEKKQSSSVAIYIHFWPFWYHACCNNMGTRKVSYYMQTKSNYLKDTSLSLFPMIWQRKNKDWKMSYVLNFYPPKSCFRIIISS